MSAQLKAAAALNYATATYRTRKEKEENSDRWAPDILPAYKYVATTTNV